MLKKETMKKEPNKAVKRSKSAVSFDKICMKMKINY